MTTKPIINLAKFVPNRLIRSCKGVNLDTMTPRAEQFEGCVLFADISGFTKLTERFSRQGDLGIERLTLALDTHFGKINDLIRHHGGDVENIAGDAILAFWCIDEHNENLEGAVMQASRCAQDLMRKFDHESIADDNELRFRMALVSGDLFDLHVGGHAGRWNYLLAGDPLLKITAMVDEAHSGEIFADTKTAEILGETATLTGPRFYRLTGQVGEREGWPHRTEEISSEHNHTLSGYVSRSLLRSLEAGQVDWLSEMRQVTVTFVSMTGLECRSVDDLKNVQAAVQRTQEIVYRYGGSLHSVSMNDKGPVIMVVFGLPHYAHENDALRAVLAMRELHASLGSLWLDCTCGIATGHAYCGPIGSAGRQIYSVRGQVVNLAARFLKAAAYRIMCDEATQAAIGGRIQFEEMPALELKGFGKPVAVFRPRSERADAETNTLVCLGREEELEAIAAVLDACREVGTGRTIIIEGEAGIGKSRLIQAASHHARRMNFYVASGAADPFNLNTPYLSWREPICGILGVDVSGSMDEAWSRTQTELADAPELAEKAPLLSAVLPFPFPDNELTVQMHGAVRAENTRSLLLAIIKRGLRRGPTLIILDDTHWCDTASRWLLDDLSAGDENLVLLTASRPSENDGQRSESAPGAYEDCLRIKLDSISKPSIKALICQTLDIREVDRDVVNFVADRTGGNPYYAQEMILALRDGKRVGIENDRCVARDDGRSLSDGEFPNSIEKVIVSRIDLLPASQQMVLKVASVIGRVFQFALLEGIFPLDHSSTGLGEDLNRLDELDITRQVQQNPEIAYTFKHAITHEVIYNLLLFSQRQLLHRAVLNWIETNWFEVLESYYPLLAQHSHHAGDYEKAAEYFERAGINVLRSGTNRESIELLEGAVDAVQQLKQPTDTIRLARLYRLLGEASIRNGALADARRHLMCALDQLGIRWPKSQFGIFARLIGALSVQGMRRLPWLGEWLLPAKTARRTEVAYVFEQLCQMFYFTNEGPALVLATTKQVNYGEGSQDERLTSRSYLLLGNVMGILGLHRAARHYQDMFRNNDRSGQSESEIARTNQFQMLYLATIGEWQTCQRLLTQSLRIAEKLGDSRYRREFLSLLGIISLPMGLLEDAIEYREKFYLSVRNASDMQTRCWGYIEQGEILQLVGDLGMAADHLDQAIHLLGDVGDAEAVWSWGLLARTRLRQGDYGAAIEAAEEALVAIDRSIPIGFYTMEGYMGTAETFLAAAESADRDNLPGLLAKAKRSVAGLAPFLRSFPIAEPRTLLWRGRLSALKGNPNKALRDMSRSLEAAKRLSMPQEIALARFHLGRLAQLSGDREQAHTHLMAAFEGFNELGAGFDAWRCEQAMADLEWPAADKTGSTTLNT